VGGRVSCRPKPRGLWARKIENGATLTIALFVTLGRRKRRGLQKWVGKGKEPMWIDHNSHDTLLIGGSPMASFVWDDTAGRFPGGVRVRAAGPALKGRFPTAAEMGWT